MIVIDCEQGTEPWHAARRGIPTASRFADIFAESRGKPAASRHNYAVQLGLERRTGRTTESFTSWQMKQGIEREPDALALYESRTGIWTRRIGFARHDTVAAGASPDSLADVGAVAFGIECKSPEPAAHLRYLALPVGTAPPEYHWQVFGQIWVCGFPWVDFVSYNPEFEAEKQLVIRRVMRHEATIDRLRIEIPVFLAEVDAICEGMANPSQAPIDAAVLADA